MKKKLLFIIESLNCGGAEKSLVTLLSVLDYEQFEVDLMLFARGGTFEQYLPPQVTILPQIEIHHFLSLDFLSRIKVAILNGKLSYLLSAIRFSMSLRLRKTSIVSNARYWWQCFSKHIPCSKLYDIAIGYGQTFPTFYVAEKARAKKKFAWVNCMYSPQGVEKAYQRPFYDALSNIVCVTPESQATFAQNYEEFCEKMRVVKDISIASQIESWAAAYVPHELVDGKVKTIVTVGRLSQWVKGYDIALRACKKLKEKRKDFVWIVVGEGDSRGEMEEYILQNDLKNFFVLVGAKSNPYPYMKHADVYVQTSRSEGYGLTIAEARILNKPVVTTEFDAVYHQMIQGKNGLVVKQDPVEVANAIERLLTDRELYDSIVAYQMQEKKGNIEEVEKFYALLDS